MSKTERIVKEAIDLLSLDPPWVYEPYCGDSDAWGDEQARSEYFEYRCEALGRLLLTAIGHLKKHEED